MILAEQHGQGSRQRLQVAAAALVAALLALFLLLSPTRQSGQAEVSSCFDGDLPGYQESVGQVLQLDRCAEQVPEIKISIQNRRYLELLKNRKVAIGQTHLANPQKKTFPAIISVADRHYKADIRLKGISDDHFKHDRAWSLKVDLKNDAHIMRMSSFSLQHPRVRHFDVDPLISEQMGLFDVLMPRYRFAQVSLNGVDWGLMELEEHFDKHLAESNQRQNSIISKLNEDHYWDLFFRAGTFAPYNNIYLATLDSYNQADISRDPQLKDKDILARSLFQAWQSGRVDLADIVDLEKFADYLVNLETWGIWSAHSLAWYNQRFYFNPFSNKFEPVCFDFEHPITPLSSEHSLLHDSQGLFELARDARFKMHIEKALVRLKTRFESGELMGRLQRRQSEISRIFAAGDSDTTVDLGLLEANIRTVLARGSDSFTGIYQRSYQSYQPISSGDLQTFAKIIKYDFGGVEIQNRLPNPIQYERLGGSRNGELVQFKEMDTVQQLEPTGLFLRPEPLYLFDDSIPRDADVVIPFVNMADDRSVISQSDEPLVFIERDNLNQFVPAESPTSLPAIAQVDELKAQVVIPTGSWRIEQPIVINNGFELLIEPGTTLEFAASAFVYTNGPLRVLGTLESQVIMRAMDQSSWRGLYVFQADKTSIINHLGISDVTTFSMPGLELSGALNFFRSNIEIDGLEVRRCEAEDALNVFSSTLRISNSSFDEIWSDAIDSDFSHGVYRNVRFGKVKGDGLDLSGSFADASGLRFEEIGDKAISVGEQSYARISDIKVGLASLGVVVKDNSLVDLKNSEFEDIGITSLMAFNKKPEYAGGIIRATERLSFPEGRAAISGPASKIIIDGKMVERRFINIAAIY
jgi:hypothetical protein